MNPAQIHSHTLIIIYELWIKVQAQGQIASQYLGSDRKEKSDDINFA
jgi:hypothetical protein